MVFAALLFSSRLALAQLSQQGPKLADTGAIATWQGYSVSLSRDGLTAIVGAPLENVAKGAARLYTRSGADWTPQAMLADTGAIGALYAYQGASVSLSYNGNTAIVGGLHGPGSTGAAWVYTRNASGWGQPTKLPVGTGINIFPGHAGQGYSVSLSYNGDTAIVGGPGDNESMGAAWVYKLSGGVWTEEAKLVGTGAIGPLVLQGTSVSLSGNGDTAILGGPNDDGGKGAAWVFTRSGGVWTQQQKLFDTGALGAFQGYSVSLSGDGNTAVVGGPADNNSMGAAWVYTRSANGWGQPTKLPVGTGAIGPYVFQGSSVSLSHSGDRAIVGGPGDNVLPGGGFFGAAWVYTRTGGVWSQFSFKLVGTGATEIFIGFDATDTPFGQGASVSLSYNGDTAIVGSPGDNSLTGAAWVYATPLSSGRPLPWAGYATIDPMALILHGKAYDIWTEIHHPHEPKVAEIQQVLQSMTPEERKAALNRARTLAIYAKAVEKMPRVMPPEKQKAALNRAKTLANYAKAIEEAAATMKK